MLRLQRRVEQRLYAKALAFAQELGDVIHEGIVRIPDSAEPSDQRFEASDNNPSAKGPFGDIRERRKLGKRILKAVQPQLETALRVESEITNKPFETLQKELEAKIEASLDAQQSVTVGSREGQGDDELGTIMVDASAPSEIRVQTESMADQETEEAIKEDAMDTDGAESGNIEVNTSGLGIINGDGSGDVEMTDDADTAVTRPANGVGPSQTPPESNGYGPSPRRGTGTQNGPPTPPQSNGSFGKDADPLADGGVFWYFKASQPQGTSILADHEPAVREDSGMLSEDLTDLDDEELKALGAEVDVSLSATVAEAATTSPKKAKASKTSKAAAKKRRTSTRRR